MIQHLEGCVFIERMCLSIVGRSHVTPNLAPNRHFTSVAERILSKRRESVFFLAQQLLVMASGEEPPKEMTEREKLREKLIAEVRAMTEFMTVSEKLEIYALGQQAKQGDVDVKAPMMLRVRERAKWDAWNKLKGMSQEDARQNFLARALELKERYGDKIKK